MHGWDVSVQYGANQPEYDLVAVDGDRMLKISVKGSKDGGWRLTQALIAKADYHGAADAWLKKHSRKTVFCLVQLRIRKWARIAETGKFLRVILWREAEPCDGTDAEKNGAAHRHGVRSGEACDRD